MVWQKEPNNLKGPAGPQGPGLPTGGTTGQVPVKASPTNHDVTWAAAPAPANMVTTNTVQNITASKTFRNHLTAAKKMQAGVERVVMLGPNLLTKWGVTFQASQFDVPPIVVVTAYTTSEAVTQCTASGATNDGFWIYVKRTNETDTIVHWIAMAPDVFVGTAPVP